VQIRDSPTSRRPRTAARRDPKRPNYIRDTFADKRRTRYPRKPRDLKHRRSPSPEESLVTLRMAATTRRSRLSGTSGAAARRARQSGDHVQGRGFRDKQVRREIKKNDAVFVRSRQAYWLKVYQLAAGQAEVRAAKHRDSHALQGGLSALSAMLAITELEEGK